jgi:ABC-type antimicrobial peptide transport system, ATPase component
MIHQPQLILADEPTGNLDTKASKDVMELLEQLNAEKATILMVTHDPQDASYCRRILFIKDGSLVSELHRGDSQREFYDEIMLELRRIEEIDNEF